MIKEAIEYLQKTAHAQLVEHDGRTYATKELHAIKSPAVDAVQLHTLDGLIEVSRPLAMSESISILVKSPSHVVAFGEPESPWRNRQVFVEAKDFDGGNMAFRFGQYYEQSEFIIGLNAWFVKTAERDKVLAFVSTVTEENAASAKDDGVTQTVATKRGAKLGVENIPNPVELAPYRSFREIEQVASKFLLRYKDGKFALFDVEGNAWQYEAVKRVAEYIRTSLTGVTVLT